MSKKVLWKKRIWLDKSPTTDVAAAEIANWTGHDDKERVDMWLEVYQGKDYLYFDELTINAAINLANFILDAIDEYDKRK